MNASDDRCGLRLRGDARGRDAAFARVGGGSKACHRKNTALPAVMPHVFPNGSFPFGPRRKAVIQASRISGGHAAPNWCSKHQINASPNASKCDRLRLDPSAPQLTITGFKLHELAQAEAEYAHAKKYAKEHPGTDAVLVAVDSVAALQRARRTRGQRTEAVNLACLSDSRRRSNKGSASKKCDEFAPSH